MTGTRTDFEPTARSFVFETDDEDGRPFRRRPGRGTERRRAIAESLRGAR